MQPSFSGSLVIVTILVLSACGTTETRTPGRGSVSGAPLEVCARAILIEVPVEEQVALEFSGLAWHGDDLVVLPENGRSVLLLRREEIAAFLSGTLSAVPTRTLPLRVTGEIAGFDGFEAIAIEGGRLWITAEVHEAHGAAAYLLAGDISESGAMIRADEGIRLPSRTTLANLSHEALASDAHSLIALYEANGLLDAIGAHVPPTATVWSATTGRSELAMEPLEYRVTGATSVRDRRFWVINYQFFGDRELRTKRDPIALRFGRGRTHADSARSLETMIVERLVELEIDLTGRTLKPSGTPPIQIDLAQMSDGRPRSLKGCNWEGIARLDDPPGFLIVADRHAPEPSTLAFVPAP